MITKGKLRNVMHHGLKIKKKKNFRCGDTAGTPQEEITVNLCKLSAV